MALKQVRTCDHFPRARDVRPVRVIVRIEPAADELAMPPIVLADQELDLSQRGRDRLLRMFSRVMAKPARKKPEGSES